MYYYLVWVRSNRYHGVEPLTYRGDKKIQSGAVVEVELQNQLVLGVVSKLTTKPKFKTKNISRILDLPALPIYQVKTMEWLIKYYPAPLGMVTQQFIPAAITDKRLEKFTLVKFDKPKINNLPKLTKEQQVALETIDQSGSYLLHGRTGSGKTRLYIELSLKEIANQRSCIILTPEISLTSQLYSNFHNTFGNRVIMIHSQQTPKQRLDAWLTCLLSKEPVVVIGPRSALFAPIKSVGLVVMDESHELAYKQQQAPQYQTSRVAGYLTNISRAKLVMGSATPLIADYYLARAKDRPIVNLTKLAIANKFGKTSITIVDRRDNSLFNRSHYLSQPLIEAIENSLSLGQQSLLYLNRRGTARLVLCENCGWQANCPNCHLPLIYHGDSHKLRCHSCNYETTPPSSCPSCHNSEIVFKTAGTKAIVDDVQKLFKGARLARFDTDNLKKDSFSENYEFARRGDIDILIGTQLIAKGLDLPNLSLVGILLADTSLYIPDFTASERTFQLLNQVIGRIGRGHVSGQAVIQTYHPDHPILKSAVNNDYNSFYESELSNRLTYHFPPFCYLLKLSTKRASAKSVQDAANQLKNELLKSYKVEVLGPAPAFIERVDGKYNWQLIVKAKNRGELIKIMAALPSGWHTDIDPVDLL